MKNPDTLTLETLKARAEIKRQLYQEKLARITNEIKTGRGPASITRFLQEDRLYITESKDTKAGKMFLVPTLSTIKFACNRCLERIATADGINCVCLYCYVDDSYNSPAEMWYLSHNYNLLQTMLSDEVINNTARALVKAATTGKAVKNNNGTVTVYPASYSVRIESKGDTDGAIQALNYYRIAAAIKAINPYVNVTAWTKNVDHYIDALALAEENAVVYRDSLKLIYSATLTDEDGVLEAERVLLVNSGFLAGYFVVYHGGKRFKAIDDDVYNEMLVLERFGPMVSAGNVTACKCQTGSCGISCNKCYNRNKLNTPYEPIKVFEHLRD